MANLNLKGSTFFIHLPLKLIKYPSRFVNCDYCFIVFYFTMFGNRSKLIRLILLKFCSEFVHALGIRSMFSCANNETSHFTGKTSYSCCDGGMLC